jgi:hypothetical protein
VEVALGFAVAFVGGGLEEVLVFGGGPTDSFGGDDPDGYALATASILFFGQHEGHIGVRSVQGPHMLGVAASRAQHKYLIGRPVF